MYIPKQFEESRVEVMHELVRAYPLATLVIFSAVGLDANHIPLYLADEHGGYGILQGHIARANPLVSEITDGIDCLAIFHGPNSYISPTWYPTKKDSGKVVPTWNYAVVHAYGVLRIMDDISWLNTQLDNLTSHNELSFSAPWAVSDAPKTYIERMMDNIVGIEIVVTKMIGKWKVSQNQPPQNQLGVISGLKELGLREAHGIADLVKKYDK